MLKRIIIVNQRKEQNENSEENLLDNIRFWKIIGIIGIISTIISLFGLIILTVLLH